MSFKDEIKSDLDIFLNDNECAELHYIGQEPVKIIVDNDKLQERKNGNDLAVAESTLLIIGSTSEMPEAKARGELITFDGNDFFVDDWQEDCGITTVAMRRAILMGG